MKKTPVSIPAKRKIKYTGKPEDAPGPSEYQYNIDILGVEDKGICFGNSKSQRNVFGLKESKT